MKVLLPKYQEGGAMPQEQGMGGGDPMEQLMMLAQQALEGQDCEAAMQVCQVLLQAASGGGGPAPAEEAPAEPVYRRGGKLVRRMY